MVVLDETRVSKSSSLILQQTSPLKLKKCDRLIVFQDTPIIPALLQ